MSYIKGDTLLRDYSQEINKLINQFTKMHLLIGPQLKLTPSGEPLRNISLMENTFSLPSGFQS